MFGGKEIIVTKLTQRGRATFRTPREVLVDMYSKRTLAEIAKSLGVHPVSVLKTMNRFNIKRRPAHTPAPKGFVAQELTRRGRTTNRSAREMFRNMYSTKGLSLQEIADELGVSLNSVYRFAVERNIPLRRVGRPIGATSTRSQSDDISLGCL